MQYQISYENPLTHFVNIKLSLDNIDSDEVILQLPNWRPGRYELAHFSKNIQKLIVLDKQGNPLPFKKQTSCSWAVSTKGVNSIDITYNYYAFKMDAGSSWLDEEQLYLNFINCLIYVKDSMNTPCQVTLKLPENYRVACGLKQSSKHILTADNYYELVSSPMIASDSLEHFHYTVNEHHFYLWFQGHVPIEKEKVINDFKKFSIEQIATLGEFPCKDYHFLFQLLPYKFYHGVEQFNSTVITLGPSTDFSQATMYSNFIGVSSHELFHTWNVIRIRPKELLPYDFSKENYFNTGYVAEGFTTYYGDLFIVRSGVFDKAWFFNKINIWFKRHFENFGRHNLSVADSSLDLWLDGYSAGIPNRKTSIYIKGAIISLMLDLELRSRSESKVTLDDVIRLLWQEFGKEGVGYSHKDIIEIFNKTSKSSFDLFFEEFVTGTIPLENRISALLDFVGCTLVISESEQKTASLFGFRTDFLSGKNKVVKIAPESPAGESLSLDDEIIEINGKTLIGDFNEEVFPEEAIELKVIRNYKQRIIKLTSDERSFFQQYRIEQVNNPNEQQKKAFYSWLKCEL